MLLAADVHGQPRIKRNQNAVFKSMNDGEIKKGPWKVLDDLVHDIDILLENVKGQVEQQAASKKKNKVILPNITPNLNSSAAGTEKSQKDARKPKKHENNTDFAGDAVYDVTSNSSAPVVELVPFNATSVPVNETILSWILLDQDFEQSL